MAGRQVSWWALAAGVVNGILFCLFIYLVFQPHQGATLGSVERSSPAVLLHPLTGFGLLLALAPVLGGLTRRPAWRAFLLAAALLMGLILTVLGAISVGFLELPAVALMFVALVRDPRLAMARPLLLGLATGLAIAASAFVPTMFHPGG